MIEKTIKNMIDLVDKLKFSIEEDLKDIKEADHEKLLDRNEKKLVLIEEIAQSKTKLNEGLVQELQKGVDVGIYKDDVDRLEVGLKELYELNKKLGLIVLPIQEMYKELVEEISLENGGKAFDIKA